MKELKYMNSEELLEVIRIKDLTIRELREEIGLLKDMVSRMLSEQKPQNR